MPSLDMLIIIAGIIYGYSRHGKEDTWGIIKKGVKIGFFIGVFFGVVGLLLNGPIAGFVAGTLGIIGFVIAAFFISVEFVIGIIIGDFLEHQIKH